MADLYATGQDLLAYVLRRAGELLPTTAAGSAPVTQADRLIDAKAYLIQAYYEICGLKPWRWNRAHKQFASIAETTAVALTISGPTVTLASTIATSMTGRKFMLVSDGVPTRILSHTGGIATLTLEVDYTGIGTAGNVSIFQDEIDVGVTDLLAHPRIKELHIGDYLVILPEAELDEIAPRNLYGRERAERAAFLDEHTVRLVPWTKARRLFELRYNPRPAQLTYDGNAATDTPVVPLDCRIIIGDRACERIYADKRDQRQQQAAAQVQDTYSRLSGREIQFGKPRGHPRKGQSVSGR